MAAIKMKEIPAPCVGQGPLEITGAFFPPCHCGAKVRTGIAVAITGVQQYGKCKSPMFRHQTHKYATLRFTDNRTT